MSEPYALKDIPVINKKKLAMQVALYVLSLPITIFLPIFTFLLLDYGTAESTFYGVLTGLLFVGLVLLYAAGTYKAAMIVRLRKALISYNKTVTHINERTMARSL